MAHPQTTPDINSLPLALSANLALERFGQLSGITGELPAGATLLYERALMHGYRPNGIFSAGGSCRLLPCRDAILAINLPRDSDWELIPAWLGPWLDDTSLTAPGDWAALTHHCQTLAAHDLLTQAHSLGLAVASANELPPPPQHPTSHLHIAHTQCATSQCHKKKPLVVDLSSLWAGPLCGHLLQQAGCRVIKVEGLNRHDGARTGCPDFYNLLNQGKESMVLDFRSDSDMHGLKELIVHADIVIEASRPRALLNAGIPAEDWVQSKPGRVWLSITGYGRDGANGERIGYGDDAAAAAGLSRIMFEATGKYQFAGDAIADPLTGIHAALFAWQNHIAGSSALISISLRDTVSWCLHRELKLSRKNVLESCQQWLRLGSKLEQLYPAGCRRPAAVCAAPGEHNGAIFEELNLLAGPLH